MKKAELYSIDDGFGIVGYGFECPYCESLNRFVSYWDETLICEDCGEELENADYETHKL